jgi:restriction system protein
MVRAGHGGEYADEFVEQGVAGLMEDRIPRLPVPISKDDLLKLYEEHYPEEKAASRASWASQLLRLITEIKVGDDVLLSDRDRRRYVLGKVVSEYVWLENVGGTKLHGRRVDWKSEVQRDLLSTATKNTLGSVLTVFKVNADATKDVLQHAVELGAKPPVAPPPPSETERNEEQLGEIAEETLLKSNEFIEDQIDALSPHEMQHLVAGLLRAMGYRTTVAERGPDRGVDVFASPDGLGLEDPRIFVEVKHRVNQAGAPEVRAFLGGRRKGDRCLYVSTGGFSKEAYYEAERADVAVTLIPLPKLRKLVLEYYEKLDPEARALVPLRRFYWPVGKVNG